MWNNYGDGSFMEYGGYLVNKDLQPDCYQVINLVTDIPDYNGKYQRNPIFVTKCYIDLSLWLDADSRKSLNPVFGYPENYIPKTESEKEQCCCDLMSWYSIWEFDPVFPKETGLGPYSMGAPFKDAIVGKTIAKKFLQECGVPAKYRK